MVNLWGGGGLAMLPWHLLQILNFPRKVMEGPKAHIWLDQNLKSTLVTSLPQSQAHVSTTWYHSPDSPEDLRKAG